MDFLKKNVTGTVLTAVSVALNSSAYVETLNVVYLILCVISVIATIAYYGLKIYGNVKDRIKDGKFDKKDADDTMKDVMEAKGAVEAEKDKIKKE